MFVEVLDFEKFDLMIKESLKKCYFKLKSSFKYVELIILNSRLMFRYTNDNIGIYELTILQHIIDVSKLHISLIEDLIISKSYFSIKYNAITPCYKNIVHFDEYIKYINDNKLKFDKLINLS